MPKKSDSARINLNLDLICIYKDCLSSVTLWQTTLRPCAAKRRTQTIDWDGKKSFHPHRPSLRWWQCGQKRIKWRGCDYKEMFGARCERAQERSAVWSSRRRLLVTRREEPGVTSSSSKLRFAHRTATTFDLKSENVNAHFAARKVWLGLSHRCITRNQDSIFIFCSKSLWTIPNKVALCFMEAGHPYWDRSLGDKFVWSD